MQKKGEKKIKHIKTQKKNNKSTVLAQKCNMDSPKNKSLETLNKNKNEDSKSPPQ